MVPIFCIVSLGRSKGKTALLEWLTRRLTKQGINVATIKHSTKGFDTEDKDTWRHLEAGAIEVVYVSPKELITLRRFSGSLVDALGAFHVDPDLILVEGFKDAPYPKILCVDNRQEVIEASKSIQNIIAVTGEVDGDEVSSLGMKFMNRDEVCDLLRGAVIDYWLKLIPGFNCGKCSYKSCEGLAKAIRSGAATIRECSMRSTLTAKLRLDAVEVPLGPWPQRLLRELLMAFVRSLKLRGVDMSNVRKMIVEIDLKTEGDKG